MKQDDTIGPHGFKQFTPENWLVPDMPGYFPNITPEKWIRWALESQLSSNVPKEIAAMFEVARGAIIQGWFFYPLLTLGGEQLHRVQEAAARLRCKQLNICPAKIVKSGKRKGQIIEPRFSELIEGLAQHGQIVKSDLFHWELTRIVRNEASHPKHQSIYTPRDAFGRLKATAQSINQIFDLVMVDSHCPTG